MNRIKSLVSQISVFYDIGPGMRKTVLTSVKTPKEITLLFNSNFCRNHSIGLLLLVSICLLCCNKDMEETMELGKSTVQPDILFCSHSLHPHPTTVASHLDPKVEKQQQQGLGRVPGQASFLS